MCLNFENATNRFSDGEHGGSLMDRLTSRMTVRAATEAASAVISPPPAAKRAMRASADRIKCTQCIELVQPQHFSRHALCYHANVIAVECPYCSYGHSWNPGNIKSHIASAHADKPAEYIDHRPKYQDIIDSYVFCCFMS